MLSRNLTTLVVAFCVSLASLGWAQYSITVLRGSTEFPEQPYPEPLAISDNGLYVGGVLRGQAWPSVRPCYWTGSSAVPTVIPISTPVQVNAISNNGPILAGVREGRPFRWQNNQFQDFLFSGGVATAITPDGGTVVGHTRTQTNSTWTSWYWHNGSLDFLDSFPEECCVEASDVSSDGSVIVGNLLGLQSAFIWKQSTGIVPIENIQGGQRFLCIAKAVSADGNVVVGNGSFGQVSNGIRWTANSGLVPVAGIGEEADAQFYDVNHDGSVLVGQISNWPYGSDAYVWTTSIEGFALRDLFEQFGTDLSAVQEEYTFRTAYRISADGSKIVVWERIVADISAGLPNQCVEGHITLEHRNLDLQKTKYAEFEIRHIDTNAVLKQGRLRVGSHGFYKLLNIPSGIDEFDLSVKLSHWLRGTRRVRLAGAITDGPNFSLKNGDVDDDNEVNLLDFGLLAHAFGSSPENARWNADADLDEDDEVNLIDYSIFVSSFGQSGDE